MVPCPLCGNDVDWVTRPQAARVLGVSTHRVSQFIDTGRLPGATKHPGGDGVAEMWRIPIASVIALKQAREGVS